MHVDCLIYRLNALEYSDLRDKLSSPVVNARNIVIHQSISERFVAAFEEQVLQNNTYHKTNDEVRIFLINVNLHIPQYCDYN